jgi:hypothetical protein
VRCLCLYQDGRRMHGIITKMTNLTVIVCLGNNSYPVRFEVFTAVTIKNGVFGDVTSCGACKN